MLPTKKFTGELNNKNMWYFPNKLDYSINDINDRVTTVYKALGAKKVISQERNVLMDETVLKRELYDGRYTTVEDVRDYIQYDRFFELYFTQSDDKEVQNYFKLNINKSDYRNEEDPVCKMLEKMANYILMCKDNLKENKKSDSKFLTDRDSDKISKKESSLNGMAEARGEVYDKDISIDSIVDEVTKRNANYKKAIKQVITSEDINNSKVIFNYQWALEWLKIKHDLGNESLNNRLKMRKMMSSLRDDQVLSKDKMNGTIYFKRILPDTTKIVFDNDTGYYDENDNYKLVSENRIDFRNALHIYELINHYSSLKMEHWDDVQSEMRYVLDTLEWLIDISGLRDFERDVITWKIDGHNGLEICDKMKIKYGLDWSEQYLSSVFKQQIPDRLVKTYIDSYEEWFYTFKAKGDYKKCSKCGKNKLKNDKYFDVDNSKRDGLKYICKHCRKS